MNTPKKAESILAGLLALLDRGRGGVVIGAEEDAELLVVRGQPINGPVVSYGRFAMSTSEDIQTDAWAGRFGQLS